MTLTQEFLVMKTRQPVNQITKLNLWGNDLCDVSILKNLTNLEILALTVNQIPSLKYFQTCTKLKELYLRRNNIPADLDELRYLQNLRNLKVLNLGENPLSTDLRDYRMYVLKNLPWLDKLDDIQVTYQELELARDYVFGQEPVKNKAYVQTTFIPNESQ